MQQKTEALLERVFNFSVNTLKTLSSLKTNQIFNVLIYQLTKASTSVGANYEEAQGAESKDDFIHKVGIVSKEARECVYWLRLLCELTKDSEIYPNIIELLKEAKELSKIFISIKLTAQQRKNENVYDQ